MPNKTVAGLLPNEWKGVLFKKISKIVRGSSPRPAGSPVYFNGDFLPWITVAEITSNESMFIYETKTRLTKEGAKHTRITPPDTLMLSNSGATLGIPKISKIKSGANDGIAMIIDIKGAEKEYLYYYLLSKTEYLRRAVASGVGQPNLNTDLIGDLPLALPPLPEQKKIAAILSTWDRAIERTEKLLANSQQQKKALMQQLLTGKKRLPGFTGEWKTVTIGSLLKEVKRPVEWKDDNFYKLLSVKRRSEGVILREVLHGTKILTKKMNYAKSGDFLISKMQIVHGASGLVPEHLDNHHISDSYIALRAKNPEKFDIEFFSWISKERVMYHKTFLCSYGVTIEKMTFNFNMYLKENIKIPPTVTEQRSISRLLNTTENEITALESDLSRLRQEKKALMQQLLTGKRRVTVD